MTEIITLSNGKRVANFSSPHPFRFEDGSVLPAVSNFMSEKLKVTFIEDELENGDIRLSFKLSDDVKREMIEYYDLWFNNELEVAFCPLPMIVAIKEEMGENYLINSPFRSIRVEDRINKVISINKQCI
jgi:hypothetical protein